jgi:4-amino-4-deoxy-L-arabinose transferase-like glycosyltransferase
MTARRSVWLVVLGALAIRVVVAFVQRDSAPVYDALDYDRHAQSIAAGDGYPDTLLAAPGTPSALRPPAYPYLLGAVYRLTGDSQLAGRLLGAVLGAVAVWLVYELGRRVWGHRVGLLAAGAAAVYPPMVVVSTSLLSETLFVPLALAALVLLTGVAGRGSCLGCAPFTGPGTDQVKVAPPATRGWGAVAAGVLCGLACLARSNGVALVVVAAVAMVVGAPRGMRLRALPAAGLVVAVAVIVVSPWAMRNADAFHSFVPLTTAGGYNLTLAYNAESENSPRARYRFPPTLPATRELFRRPGIDEAELNSRLQSKARRFAADHPGYVAEVVWWNSLRMLSLPPGEPDNAFAELNAGGRWRDVLKASGWVVAALAVAGLGLCALRRDRRAWLPAAALALLWLSVVPALGSARYRAAVDPLLVLFAAVAVAGLVERARSRTRSASVAPNSSQSATSGRV